MRLESINLDVSIGRKKILHDLNFVLDTHKFIGIIGPNGSGKSTLLKTFYKAIQPNGGCVLVDGRNIKEMTHRQCARTFAVLPQRQDSDIAMTVKDVVHMGRYPDKRFFDRATDKEWTMVMETLSLLELEQLSERKMSTLSGGEWQMVMIARAIVQDTVCLLLDEPTNHLDISHQLMILDTLAALNKQLIVVFHDLSLAGKYCDYLYIMKNGRLETAGRPVEVLTSQTIFNVYGIKIEVIPHPRTGRPIILP